MMDPTSEAEYVEGILNDIRHACKTLEQSGFDSLVLLASGDRHFEVGSPRGMQFNEENFDYIEKFMEYCQDKLLYPLKYEAELDDLNDSNRKGQGAETAKTATYKRPNPSQRPLIVTVPQETHSSSMETEVNDGDSDFDNFEIDIESREHRDAVRADIIPKSNVIIIKTFDVEEKRGIPGTKAGSSSRNLRNTVSKATKKSPSRSIAQKKAGNQGVKKERTYYECDQCEKRYLANKDLTIHKRKHSGDTPYVCHICSKRFRGGGLLRAHMQCHDPEKRYSCDICGMFFIRRNSVHRHKISAHSETPPSYICDVCGRKFSDQSSHRMHKLRHGGYKPHSCPVCGRSFLEARALVAHQRIHTGEKPFTCEFCGDHFRMKKNMLTHQRRKHEI